MEVSKHQFGEVFMKRLAAIITIMLVLITQPVLAGVDKDIDVSKAMSDKLDAPLFAS